MTDVLVSDVDGVLCHGARPVPGAAETIAALRKEGVAMLFATNQSQGGKEVAAHLRGMGFAVHESEVVTSADAVRELVATELPAGSVVTVIGRPALREAVLAAGLKLAGERDASDALVLGHAPDLVYNDLVRAVRIIGGGGRFIAANHDLVLPSPEGPLPATGSIVAAIVAATGVNPTYAGKPNPPMMRCLAGRIERDARVVMVGDTPSTDLAGAESLGWTKVLVLSGVTSSTDAARAAVRPDFVFDSICDVVVHRKEVFDACTPTNTSMSVN